MKSRKFAASTATVEGRIRWYLEKLWMGSQSAMARDINLPQGTISNVLRGHRTPGAKILRAIEAHPLVNHQWLQSGIGEPLLVETKVGQGIPVAFSLLPGPPANYPELLSSRVELVPSTQYRETLYAVEAAACLPISTDPNERMLPTDIIIIDTNVKAWEQNLQLLHRKLCAISRPSEKNLAVTLQRLACVFGLSENEHRLEYDGAQVGRERNSRNAETVAKKRFGKELRGFDDLTSSVEQSDSSAKDEEKVSFSDVVGVAIQLIRSL